MNALSDNTPPPYVRGRFYQLKDSPTGGAGKSPLHSREKQVTRRRVAETARRPSPVVHVRSYARPSWFTSIGVSRKRKMIERKGMPNLHNWRFITLTFRRKPVCDEFGNVLHSAFDTPLEAYLAGVDHMRRFLYACRKEGLWACAAKWCWKLEFQADGWPHWHLLVERRDKMSHAELAKVGELWGFGRANVERVNEKGFCYNFKYAFKPVIVEGDDEDGDEFERLAPDWFLDYVSSKTVLVEGVEVEKPVTFTRARFWQTSRGFYTARKEKPAKPKPQVSWTVPVTVREGVEAAGRVVQVCSRGSDGRYQSSICVRLDRPLEDFWNLVGFDTVHGGAVGLGVFSYVIPAHRITTDKITSWKLQQHLQTNRLNLRLAARLQEKGTNLRTC